MDDSLIEAARVADCAIRAVLDGRGGISDVSGALRLLGSSIRAWEVRWGRPCEDTDGTCWEGRISQWDRAIRVSGGRGRKPMLRSVLRELAPLTGVCEEVVA